MKKQKTSEGRRSKSQVPSAASGTLHHQEKKKDEDTPNRDEGSQETSAEEARSSQDELVRRSDPSKASEGSGEGLESWERQQKKEASRLSSMRCQQRKKRRIEHLKESQEQLRFSNKKLSEQNESLRTLISLIREVSQASGQQSQNFTAPPPNPFLPLGTANNIQPSGLAPIQGHNFSQSPLGQERLDLAPKLTTPLNQHPPGGAMDQWLAGANLSSAMNNPQGQPSRMLPPSIHSSTNNNSTFQESVVQLLQNYLNLPQQHQQQHGQALNHTNIQQQQPHVLTQSFLITLQAYLQYGSGNSITQPNASTATSSDGRVDQTSTGLSSAMYNPPVGQTSRLLPSINSDSQGSTLQLLQNYMNSPQQSQPQQRLTLNQTNSQQQQLSSLAQSLLIAYLQHGSGNGLEQSNASTVTASDTTGQHGDTDETRDSSTRTSSNNSD